MVLLNYISRRRVQFGVRVFGRWSNWLSYVADLPRGFASQFPLLLTLVKVVKRQWESRRDVIQIQLQGFGRLYSLNLISSYDSVCIFLRFLE